MINGYKAATARSSGSSTLERDRILVRVIWGSGLGSVYQRYSEPQLNMPTDAEADGAGSSPEPGSSLFSRSLDCPDCRGSLVPHQPRQHDPDRLIGICQACDTHFRLDVGDRGRIQSTRLSWTSAVYTDFVTEALSCH